MKRAAAMGVMLLAVSLPLWGQQGQLQPRIGVQIVTDREGVDFEPYLRELVIELMHNWKEPTGKSGLAFTRLQIKPDGTIRASDPVLERTSGDETVAEAATADILASKPFKPLPAEFHGVYLEVRIAFACRPSLFHPISTEISGLPTSQEFRLPLLAAARIPLGPSL